MTFSHGPFWTIIMQSNLYHRSARQLVVKWAFPGEVDFCLTGYPRGVWDDEIQGGFSRRAPTVIREASARSNENVSPRTHRPWWALLLARPPFWSWHITCGGGGFTVIWTLPLCDDNYLLKLKNYNRAAVKGRLFITDHLSFIVLLREWLFHAFLLPEVNCLTPQLWVKC